MKFFNSRVSTITFGLSVLRGTVQVSMARAKDPNFTGRPQKGQHIFDFDNTVYFSLSPSECFKISESLDGLMKGSFTNPNPKEQNTQFKDKMTVTHFRDNQPSKLVVEQSKDSNGSPSGTLRITILPPKSDGAQIVSYTFRRDELYMFREFMKRGWSEFPFQICLSDALQKQANSRKYNDKNNNGNGSGNSNSQYNNNKQSSNTTTTNAPTFEDTPTQTAPAEVNVTVDQTANKPDDVDFDW